MGPQIVLILSGVVFMLAILYLLLRKKSNVSYSLIWLGMALAVIIIGIFPHFLDIICIWLNIDYPPIFVTIIAVLFLLIFIFYISSELSVAKSKISELSMQLSLLNNDIVEFKEDLRNENKIK